MSGEHHEREGGCCKLHRLAKGGASQLGSVLVEGIFLVTLHGPDSSLIFHSNKDFMFDANNYFVM